MGDKMKNAIIVLAVLLTALVFVAPLSSATSATMSASATVTATYTTTESATTSSPTSETTTTTTVAPIKTTLPPEKITNTEEMKTAAQTLISVASMIREKLLDKANGQIPDYASSDFELANHYYDEAVKAYNDGQYDVAIKFAVQAIRGYKKVNAEISINGNINDKETVRIKIMLDHDKAYLQYASNVIETAKQEGHDVSKAEALYSQAVKLHAQLEKDLQDGNVQQLRVDFKTYVQVRAELRVEVNNLSKDHVEKNMNKILEKYNTRMQKLIERMQKRGVPPEVIEQIQQKYQTIQELIKEGKLREALKDLKDANKNIIEKVRNKNWGNWSFNGGGEVTWTHAHGNEHIDTTSTTPMTNHITETITTETNSEEETGSFSGGFTGGASTTDTASMSGTMSWGWGKKTTSKGDDS
jgi:type VI protein secretion system component VasF